MNKLRLKFNDFLEKKFIENKIFCKKLFYFDEIYYCWKDVIGCYKEYHLNFFKKFLNEEIDSIDKYSIEELQKKKRGENNPFEKLNNDLIFSLEECELYDTYITKKSLFKFIGIMEHKNKKSEFINFIYDDLSSFLDLSDKPLNKFYVDNPNIEIELSKEEDKHSLYYKKKYIRFFIDTKIYYLLVLSITMNIIFPLLQHI